jgi:hypothetical protein
MALRVFLRPNGINQSHCILHHLTVYLQYKTCNKNSVLSKGAIMALTALEVSTSKATDKPRKLFDGYGMYLLIQPNNAKYWRWNYRFTGKRKTLSLGVYPQVSIEAARAERENARALLVNGIDPSKVRRAQKDQHIADQHAQVLARINPVFQLSMKDDALTIKTKITTLALTPEQTAAVRAILIATPNEVCDEQAN